MQTKHSHKPANTHGDIKFSYEVKGTNAQLPPSQQSQSELRPLDDLDLQTPNSTKHTKTHHITICSSTPKPEISLNQTPINCEYQTYPFDSLDLVLYNFFNKGIKIFVSRRTFNNTFLAYFLKFLRSRHHLNPLDTF